jgi:hypothetical protein
LYQTYEKRILCLHLEQTTMRQYSFFALLLGLPCFTLTATGQEVIQYPYNPDVDNDAYIATSDLTGFLAQFGQEFQPAPVLIDSVDLLSVIQMMQAQINALQAQVNALESSSVPGLGAYMSIDDSAHTVLVSGANLQVVNGLGTDLSQNGLGNIIGGYNTPASESELLERTGSHNIIVGQGHRYTGNCNLIGGQDNFASGTWGIVLGTQNDLAGIRNVMIGGSNNQANGAVNVVLGGAANVVDGEWNVVLGGQSNQANGQKNVVLGGQENLASGGIGAIMGGRTNSITGGHGAIVGGTTNSLIGDAGSIVGGENNSIGTDSTDTRYTAVVGGRYNVILEGYSNSIFGGQNNRCESPSNGDGSFANRAIFGGIGNANRALYGSAIFGGHGNVAQLRDADNPDYYPADFLFGGAGRAFVGSTSPAGGQLINTTFGPGDD